MPLMRLSIGMLLIATFSVVPPAKAEFRSAKDMQKECRVALQVMNGTAEKNFENVLYTGECIGYIQGAIDASQPLAESTSWYKVCVPDNVSTDDLIRRFITFVDVNPKYTLASTAIQMMLAERYSCKK
jgi:hypothetical protein